MFWKKFIKCWHKPGNLDTRILIIEDSALDMKIACAAVERGGYGVLTASDGKSGLALARAHQPDLILLDYNLPDIQGPKICSRLKEHATTRGIPVLFLTSQDSPDSVLDCYEQGAANYLAKPISPAHLLKQIQLTLKETHKD